MAGITAAERLKKLQEDAAKIQQKMRVLKTAENEEKRKLRTSGLTIVGAQLKNKLGEKVFWEVCASVTRPQDVRTLERLGWLTPPRGNTPQT